MRLTIKHKDIYFNRLLILSFIIISIKESNTTMEPIERINIQQYFTYKIDHVVVDVRSPVEFLQGRFPEAHNIPLFSNEERATVGTIYKQQGKELAVEKGFAFVSPKLLKYIEIAKTAAPQKKIILHCFRGGMRSKNFAWLLQTAGFEVKIFEGGYKKYRLEVLDLFKQAFQFIIIGGYTGSAKTEIIKLLKSKGEQVIDLESLANHKGSSFGSINEKTQPTQQNFENQLFEQLHQLNKEKPIYLEDEAYNIGRVSLPYEMWLQMKKAPILSLNINATNRIQQLVKDYTTVDIELLKAAMFRIKDQLGGAGYKQAILFLSEKRLAEAAAIALDYYDKTYTFNHNKRFCRNIYNIDSDRIDVLHNTELILNFYHYHQQKIWEETHIWQQKFNLQVIAKVPVAAVK
jgi:tRNA 2-selenouridine synthase